MINDLGLSQDVHKVIVKDANKFNALVEEQGEEFRTIVQFSGPEVVASGANLLFVEKGINERDLDHLAKAEVLGVRRVTPMTLEKIAKATGGNIAMRYSLLSPEDLGSARLVEERKLAGQAWVFLEGCEEPKAVTILLRGTSDAVLEEAETAVRGGLCAVRNELRDPKVVGGGAFETEVAVRLRRSAKSQYGKVRLAIECLSEALESIPYALAKNSGLNPLDTILELRSRHHTGEMYAGIEGNSEGAIFPFSCKAYTRLRGQTFSGRPRAQLW